MAHKFQSPLVPPLMEIESRAGVREAVRNLYKWTTNFLDTTNRYNLGVSKELTPLYGEKDFDFPNISIGAQTTTTVTVDSAILGYYVSTTFSLDLQGLQMTSYISAEDTVTIVLKNDTAGAINLASGRLRCYVTPKDLST